MKIMSLLLLVVTCTSAAEEKTRASGISMLRAAWCPSRMGFAKRQNYEIVDNTAGCTVEVNFDTDNMCIGKYVIPWLDGGSGYTEVWRLSDTHVLMRVKKLTKKARWYTKAIPMFAPDKEAEEWLADNRNYGLERHGRKLSTEYAAIVEKAKPLTPEYEAKLLGEAQKKLELLGKKPAPAAAPSKPEES